MSTVASPASRAKRSPSKMSANSKSSSSTGTLKERFKQQWETFKADEPGERFVKLYERRQENRGSGFDWKRFAIMGLGVLLILAGIFFLAAPGPGMIVLVGGLGLLASESLTLARFLDWSEVKLRPWAEKGLKLWRNLQPGTKGAIIGAGLVALGIAGYLFYQWQLRQTTW